MRIDPAASYFLPSDRGEVFIPWADLILVGALWGFLVPTDVSRPLLARYVRVHWWCGLALFAILFPLGIMLRSEALMWSGVLLSLMIYSLLVTRYLRRLKRIPARESLRLVARRFGEMRLWQNVFLGFGALFCAFAFNTFPLPTLLIVPLFTANALFALLEQFPFLRSHVSLCMRAVSTSMESGGTATNKGELL